MSEPRQLLPSIIENTKYARYESVLQRRETWDEICNRNMQMHLNKFKNEPEEFKEEIKRIYKEYVIPKKVLFSMRSAQFAGKAIELSPNRIYNCAYLPIDSFTAFSETMFLLLGGTGVGYSVQKHHVMKMPHIVKPSADRTYRHNIGDSKKDGLMLSKHFSIHIQVREHLHLDSITRILDQRVRH